MTTNATAATTKMMTTSISQPMVSIPKMLALALPLAPWHPVDPK